MKGVFDSRSQLLFTSKFWQNAFLSFHRLWLWFWRSRGQRGRQHSLLPFRWHALFQLVAVFTRGGEYWVAFSPFSLLPSLFFHFSFTFLFLFFRSVSPFSPVSLGLKFFKNSHSASSICLLRISFLFACEWWRSLRIVANCLAKVLAPQQQRSFWHGGRCSL